MTINICSWNENVNSLITLEHGYLICYKSLKKILEERYHLYCYSTPITNNQNTQNILIEYHYNNKMLDYDGVCPYLNTINNNENCNNNCSIMTMSIMTIYEHYDQKS